MVGQHPRRRGRSLRLVHFIDAHVGDDGRPALENILLTARVWALYRGLLLSSTFATAHKPVILTGSCRNGEIGLRQQQDIDVSTSWSRTTSVPTPTWLPKISGRRQGSRSSLSGSRRRG